MGVSQVLKYSTGVSRSMKRKERIIMPSSSGKSTDCPCGRAQVKREGVAAAASAAAEMSLRKSRLEFMVVAPTPDSSRRERGPSLMGLRSVSFVTPDLRPGDECCRFATQGQVESRHHLR